MNEIDALLRRLHAYRETYITSVRGGREVHALWKDCMLAQGREVPPQRMEWETLDIKDRWLDHMLASGLVDDFLSYVLDRMTEERGDHE